LIACVAAPFLSNASLGQKFGLAFLGLCAFLISLVASCVLVFVVHGMPLG
jgi:hypothetical protein